MDIQVSGHHVAASDSIYSVVKNNLHKIGERYPKLVNISVTLKSESKFKSVEARTVYEGSSISVSSKGKTIRSAIKATVKKLEVMLAKRKGLLRSSRSEKLPEIVESIDVGSEEEYFSEEEQVHATASKPWL